MLVARPPRGRRPRGSSAARARRRRPRRRRPARATIRGASSRRASRNSRGPLRGLDLDAAGGRSARPACPAATSSPRAMIATRSQTSSTSDSRCEFSSTATPSRAQVLEQPRGRCGGRRGRAPRSARRAAAAAGRRSSPGRCPSRCCMPLDIVADAAVGPRLEADALEQPRALARAAARRPRAAGAARAARRRSPSRGSGTARRGSRARRWRRSSRGGRDPRAAAGRLHEPAGDLHQRRLAGAVGAEQADQLAGADLEVDALERGPSVRSACAGWPEDVRHPGIMEFGQSRCGSTVASGACRDRRSPPPAGTAPPCADPRPDAAAGRGGVVDAARRAGQRGRDRAPGDARRAEDRDRGRLRAGDGGRADADDDAAPRRRRAAARARGRPRSTSRWAVDRVAGGGARRRPGRHAAVARAEAEAIDARTRPRQRRDRAPRRRPARAGSRRPPSYALQHGRAGGGGPRHRRSAVDRRARRPRGTVNVLACETRPLLQGARLTIWELRRLGHRP